MAIYWRELRTRVILGNLVLWATSPGLRGCLVVALLVIAHEVTGIGDTYLGHNFLYRQEGIFKQLLCLLQAEQFYVVSGRHAQFFLEEVSQMGTRDMQCGRDLLDANGWRHRIFSQQPSRQL